MDVFVDTSAIIAMVDESQPDHQAAAEAWRRLREQDAHLVTTNYVVVEIFAAAQRRFGWAILHALIDTVIPLFETHWIHPPAHIEAAVMWQEAEQRRLSLVDCSSMKFIEARGLKHVLAFDKHFEGRGYLLPPFPEE